MRVVTLLWSLVANVSLCVNTRAEYFTLQINKFGWQWLRVMWSCIDSSAMCVATQLQYHQWDLLDQYVVCQFRHSDLLGLIIQLALANHNTIVLSLFCLSGFLPPYNNLFITKAMDNRCSYLDSHHYSDLSNYLTISSLCWEMSGYLSVPRSIPTFTNLCVINGVL